MGNEPWRSEEWKERREEVIGEKCELCDGTENLNVHHLKRRRAYKEIDTQVFYILYKELKEQGKLPLELIEVTYKDACPNCGKTNIRFRTTMEPKYRCSNCKTDFDEPAKKEKKKERALMSYVGKNYQKEIRERIDAIKKKEDKEYLKTDEVITLCKKCHYFHHQGKKLCKRCKEKYVDFRYELCWDCNIAVQKRGGRVLCKFCEIKFHSENKKACPECSIQRSDFKCSICEKKVYGVQNFCYECEQHGICSDCAAEHEKKLGHCTVNPL